MNRFLLHGLLLLLLASSITWTACGSKREMEQKKLEETGQEAERPNIVFIFADDLGIGDLSCFGAEDIQTPNMDRLAYEGIKFHSFYACASICTPSRMGFVSGRYPVKTDHRFNSVLFPNSDFGLPDSVETIAELLKKKGYATACIGKWHLGHKKEYLPMNYGFDYCLVCPTATTWSGSRAMTRPYRSTETLRLLTNRLNRPPSPSAIPWRPGTLLPNTKKSLSFSIFPTHFPTSLCMSAPSSRELRRGVCMAM